MLFDRPFSEPVAGIVLILVLLLGSLFGVRSSHAQYRLWQSFSSPNVTEYGRFGGAVARVGDVGGNDVPDVIVGAAPEDVEGTKQAGRAYVLDGATGGVLDTLTSPNPDSAGLFGSAVAGIGDVDGGGGPDLVVGAEGETVNGNEVAGRVYVFSGENGSRIRTITSDTIQSHARFGNSVAGADINEDGEADILIGAFLENVQGVVGAGRIYLVSTATWDTIRTSVSDDPTTYGLFGASVAGVDDVTGNGSPDVLVGAPGETVQDTSEGRAHLLEGASLNHTTALTSPNETRYGDFGQAVAAVGDVNGDGTADVGVGAPSDSGATEPVGRAYILNGADNGTITSLSSPSPDSGGKFGAALTGVDDVDGDGAPDILVGAPGENDGYAGAGQAYLLRGADGSVVETLASPDPKYKGDFGIAVAEVGHAGGGQTSDLLVGANKENADGVIQGGNAYMFTEPPAPPSGLTVDADSIDINVSWDPADADYVAGYRVYRDTTHIDSTAGPDSYTAIGSISSGTSSYVDTSTIPEATHHYRVTAVNGAGVESAFSASDRLFLYPEEILADVTRSFADANEPGDYELVALPGAASRPLAETMDGEAGLDWQAYWDDGTSSSFLQKADGSSTFEFRPGRGFWVTSTSNLDVQATIPSVALQGDTATAIELHDGWNIVSNPLGRDVSWGAVERATGTDLKPLWDFGNTFVRTSTFASAQDGTAYYFRNDQGLDSLRIPHPGTPDTKRTSRFARTGTSLALTARPKGEAGTASTIRVRPRDPSATSDGSAYVVAPPSRFSRVSLRIEPDKQFQRGRLAEVCRPLNEDGHTFNLRLRNRTSQKVRLRAQGIEAIQHGEVVLLRPGTGTVHDLRRDSTMLLSDGRRDSVDLKLALGTKRYVEGERKRVLPDEVSLSAYPNPVRDQATLSYSLPEETEVMLVLYDVLGRRVDVLAQGAKRAGQHRVDVAASSLASGVYFGRLQAGQERRVQKITVVR